MLRLNNITPANGSKAKKKRIGRGQGSGYGTQAGKGHKGQKARAGGGVRIGFEGGSMPIYMRLPKSRKFSNKLFSKKIVVVTLRSLLSKVVHGSHVTVDFLRQNGLLKSNTKGYVVKVIGAKNTNIPSIKISKEIELSAGAREAFLSTGCAFV